MSARHWIIKLLPWIITSAILMYLGYTTDFGSALQRLKETNFLGFIPTVIVVCIVVFLIDSGCLVLLFARFNAPVGFREMLPLKGTSYFLNIINYNAAAASIAVFFRNRKGVPLLEALGSMLWMNFIDIVSLTTLMLLGMALAGGDLDPALRNTLLASAGGIYLILIGSCVYWMAGYDFVFFGRFRTWRIFSAFAKAEARDYVLFIALRTGFVTTYVLSQWVSMPFFNLDATLRELLLYVPIITFVGTIPLTTIAGLGTVQVLMQEFFYGFSSGGTEAEVLSHINAYSTVTILSFVLCRILIGYICMGSVTRDFQRASAAQSNAAAQSRDSTDAER